MKTLIDIDTWNRKEHFLFFSKFEEPFHGVTIKLDVTNAYVTAKAQQISFFLHYLYCALKAANAIENFRYRIIGENVYLYDVIDDSHTINRADNTFGIGYVPYFDNEADFIQAALKENERVRNTTALFPELNDENLIHFSAIPWLDFTSLSHARSFSHPDSCPKISFGKVVTSDSGTKEMNVSIHVHHALVDGYHVGLFAEKFQQLLNE